MFKKITSNTLAQLVAKFFGVILTLTTTYYTIRLAGLDLYGDLIKILVLVAIGFTAIDFGLNAQAVRAIASTTKMRLVLGDIISTRLFLSLLVIVTLNLVIVLLPGGYSANLKSIFWVGSLAIIFQGFYTSANAWFQSNLTYWRSTLAVVIGSLFGALLTFYYLYYSPTLPHLVLANTLGYLVMALCCLFLLPRPLTLRLHPSTIFHTLKGALTLGLILLASVFAAKLDIIILGILRTSSEVGEYGFAYRIFDVILVLPVFVMNAVFPLLLGQAAPIHSASLVRRTTLSLLILGTLASLCLWFAAPAVLYVKAGLTLAPTILRILALSLPLFYVTAPLMWALIAQHQDRLVLNIYLGAGLLNLGLNLSFIPHYGALAAAYSTGATELFIFFALLYFSRTPKHL